MRYARARINPNANSLARPRVCSIVCEDAPEIPNAMAVCALTFSACRRASRITRDAAPTDDSTD